MAAGLSILVVDEYPDTAESLGCVLRGYGHDARVARSGTEALGHLDGWRPEVAILDLAMPGMDGVALAEKLCEDAKHRPLLVAISGTMNPNLDHRVRAVGFDHHFLKPVDPCELAEVLRRHAADRAANLSAEAAGLRADAARILADTDQTRAAVRDRGRGRRDRPAPAPPEG